MCVKLEKHTGKLSSGMLNIDLQVLVPLALTHILVHHLAQEGRALLDELLLCIWGVCHCPYFKLTQR